MFEFLKKKKKSPAGGNGNSEPSSKSGRGRGKSRGQGHGGIGRSGGGGGRGRGNSVPKKLVVPLNHNLTTAMNLDKSDERVYFGALGGMLEVGCNLYLYGHKGDWIIVDMGRGFPDEDMSGSDYTIPDISFLNAIKGRIKGLLLTHGHLDHLGAIPDLWSMVKCPVYGTPFTLGILERSLNEFGLLRQVELKKIDKEGARFKLGAFDVEYMHVTHSIPQASFLIFRTSQGTIVHTGDFKFDPTPTIDNPTDLDYIAKIGREGDVVCMCDTLIEDRPTSEATTAKALEEAIMGIKSGKIVVTCFSTNIARIGSIAKAAAKKGRMVALLGRSIESNMQVAKDCDYLLGIEPVVGKDVQKFKPDQLVYICTGNQGEPRAVLSRIADGSYEKLKLSHGDNVIFSSLVIPGNEKKISAMKNALVKQGVNIIDKRSNPDIHAHGHPVKEDLETLHKALKPRVVLSMHGEPIMVKLGSEIAKACKVPEFVSLENGQFVAIERGKSPKVVETVPTDELYVDGSRHLTSVSEEFGARRKVNDNGALFITIAVGQNGIVGKPSVSSIGVFESDGTGAFKGALAKGVVDSVKKLGKNPSDASVKDAVAHAVRKIARDIMDKDPPVEVHITRV
jgi:ribonuclease J